MYDMNSNIKISSFLNHRSLLIQAIQAQDWLC